MHYSPSGISIELFICALEKLSCDVRKTEDNDDFRLWLSDPGDMEYAFSYHGRASLKNDSPALVPSCLGVWYGLDVHVEGAMDAAHKARQAMYIEIICRNHQKVAREELVDLNAEKFEKLQCIFLLLETFACSGRGRLLITLSSRLAFCFYFRGFGLVCW